MTDTITGAPTAGWYPDPIVTGNIRWFDGKNWTSHSAPKPTGNAPLPAAPLAIPSSGPVSAPPPLSATPLGASGIAPDDGAPPPVAPAMATAALPAELVSFGPSHNELPSFEAAFASALAAPPAPPLPTTPAAPAAPRFPGSVAPAPVPPASAQPLRASAPPPAQSAPRATQAAPAQAAPPAPSAAAPLAQPAPPVRSAPLSAADLPPAPPGLPTAPAGMATAPRLAGLPDTSLSAPRAGEANPPLPHRAQDDRRNFPATIGLILGLLSVVVPVLVLSVAAFIVGGIGASRARGWGRLGYRPNGRRRAGWGVFLGIVGVLLSIVVGYVVLRQWMGVDLGLNVGAYLDPVLAWLRGVGVPIP